MNPDIMAQYEALIQEQRERNMRNIQQTQQGYNWIVTDAFGTAIRPDAPKVMPLKQRRDEEKAMLTGFLKTGIVQRNIKLKLHTNRDGTKLFVSCHNINNHTLLFVLDKTARTITANVARVRHVRPLINDLAEREGLRLKMRLKEHPDPSGAERNNLLYWKFNTEVDDSDLVSRAKLSLTGLHSDDADECDDCYCDNCCGTCGCCCDCED